MLVQVNDARRREELSREAVAMAPQGDPATLAFALVGRHSAGWTPDNVGERLVLADESEALARFRLQESIAPSWTAWRGYAPCGALDDLH